MDWASLFGRSPLVQYPDKRLWNSALALKPEERPRVPVRVTYDYEKQYKEYGKRGKMGNEPLPEGFTSPRRDVIYVNGRMPPYKDKGRLSALLAHEAYHASDDSSDHPATKEYKAREKELEVLERLGGYGHITGRIRALYGINK